MDSRFHVRAQNRDVDSGDRAQDDDAGADRADRDTEPVMLLEQARGLNARENDPIENEAYKRPSDNPKSGNDEGRVSRHHAHGDLLPVPRDAAASRRTATCEHLAEPIADRVRRRQAALTITTSQPTTQADAASTSYVPIALLEVSLQSLCLS